MDDTSTDLTKLSILQYNIFFGQLDNDTPKTIKQRLDSLCSQIKSIGADVVCLQEVTPGRYGHIVDELREVYPFRYPDSISRSYDCAVFSKLRIDKKARISFSITNMDRAIIFVTIASPFKDGEKIGIATSHFESEFGKKKSDISIKLNQYLEAVDILEEVKTMCGIENLIFASDFNSHNMISDIALYKAFRYDATETKTWKDVWIEDGKKLEDEFTYDSRDNPIMLALQSKFYVSRLDRIFHKSDFILDGMSMIKSSEPLSDHYPIVATFKTSGVRKEYTEYDPNKWVYVEEEKRKTLQERLRTVSLFKS